MNNFETNFEQFLAEGDPNKKKILDNFETNFVKFLAEGDLIKKIKNTKTMNRIKHFMILALALAMSLGAWAQGHQRYSSEVAIGSLQVGDTLAEGFSLTSDNTYNGVRFNTGRASRNGEVIGMENQIYYYSIASYGDSCAITSTVGNKIGRAHV